MKGTKWGSPPAHSQGTLVPSREAPMAGLTQRPGFRIDFFPILSPFCLHILLPTCPSAPSCQAQQLVRGLASHGPLLSEEGEGRRPQNMPSLRFHSAQPPMPGQGSRFITTAPVPPDLWSHLPLLAQVGPHMGWRAWHSQYTCSVTPTPQSRWPHGRGGVGAGVC